MPSPYKIYQISKKNQQPQKDAVKINFDISSWYLDKFLSNASLVMPSNLFHLGIGLLTSSKGIFQIKDGKSKDRNGTKPKIAGIKASELIFSLPLFAE